MNLGAIASATTVFIDANVYIYTYSPHATFGPACQQFLKRVESGDLRGFTSSDVVSDVAHRMLCLEACARFGWPYSNVAWRLKRHPAELKTLTMGEIAVDLIKASNVTIISATWHHVKAASKLSKQFGLMTKDSLIVAMMQEEGIQQLASHDLDFDRVTGIVRFDAT